MMKEVNMSRRRHFLKLECGNFSTGMQAKVSREMSMLM